MDVKEFIGSTVYSLDSKYYAYLKGKLVGEYLEFSFVDEAGITKEAFCEKLVDYFEKMEIKSSDKFSKLLARYVADMEDVVKRYIPKEPSAKKTEQNLPVPRSVKYYKHAQEIKGSRNLTLKQIEDYSRIMLSLYMSAINSEMKEVNNYEFSTEKWDLERIIGALKAEKAGLALPLGKKTMFNLEDLYCTDTVTFIMNMIMFCHIKNHEVKGEY